MSILHFYNSFMFKSLQVKPVRYLLHIRLSYINRDGSTLFVPLALSRSKDLVRPFVLLLY